MYQYGDDMIHMKAVKIMTQVYGDLLKVTKSIIKYGLIFIISVYTIAVVTYLLAGIKFDYYTAVTYAKALADSACRCVAVLGLGVILFEGLANSSISK